MNKNYHKKKYGFSLIESLIAVAILMIAITGPLALVQAGLFSANHERNQITAIYLAQEALEYVRSLRDANDYRQYDIPGTSWLNGPDAATSLLTTCGGNGCLIDPHGGLGGAIPFIKNLTTLPDTNYIYKKTNNGVFVSYGYDINSATPTSFTRRVVVSPAYANGLGNIDEVTVSVTVNWSDNALPRTYTISENLLNYQVAD